MLPALLTTRMLMRRIFDNSLMVSVEVIVSIVQKENWWVLHWRNESWRTNEHVIRGIAWPLLKRNTHKKSKFHHTTNRDARTYGRETVDILRASLHGFAPAEVLQFHQPQHHFLTRHADRGTLLLIVWFVCFGGDEKGDNFREVSRHTKIAAQRTRGYNEWFDDLPSQSIPDQRAWCQRTHRRTALGEAREKRRKWKNKERIKTSRTKHIIESLWRKRNKQSKNKQKNKETYLKIADVSLQIADQSQNERLWVLHLQNKWQSKF